MFDDDTTIASYAAHSGTINFYTPTSTLATSVIFNLLPKILLKSIYYK